ncbi:NADH dehydrogenase [ubiquinone] 1 beta subcomplex subunit 4-like [Acipenser ruthenus]|uniref:NADH dehydrogenase [ubiquinone] 1 beta subcomplex subunit 4-like n=1 Tax=Acipenser ruthenus TaxID=7906 RepID=UPI002741BFF8|nr:NADH dehydrogenase [ubiquinone] 1 beta subcomplex subunit 4-like [Acipenser ruthenus]
MLLLRLLLLADYQDAPLASRPKTLDPAEYFAVFPAKRKAEKERAAIRGQLKRQFQLQLNNPRRVTTIKYPSLTRWTYACVSNVYPTFRPTPKNSLLGAVCGIAPLLFWYFVFKTDRDRKEKLIQEGTTERPFQLSS